MKEYLPRKSAAVHSWEQNINTCYTQIYGDLLIDLFIHSHIYTKYAHKQEGGDHSWGAAVSEELLMLHALLLQTVSFLIQ